MNNQVSIPGYSFKVFYSSGWNDNDIKELCRIAEKIGKERVTKGKRANFNLDRILNICSVLEEELIKHVENKDFVKIK